MLLFRPIWQKGLTIISMMKVERAVGESDHQTINLRDESLTYPDGIRFLRGLLNKPINSIWFTNKCKNNSLVNGLGFVFLTQKEPVHKSHLLMKPTPTTLGALRARATIVHSLVKDLFFFPLFSVTLSSPRLKSSTWKYCLHLYFILW